MPGNRIEIDLRYCKGCALCTSVCPQKLIELDSQLNAQGFYPATTTPANLERCTACALCARICPDSAISVFHGQPKKERDSQQ